MPRQKQGEAGFSLIEVLVTLFLLSIVTTGMYAVLFNAQRGSQRVRDIATISGEARLGFNRMVRDTREASNIDIPDPNTYSIEVDFDGDGVIEPIPSDPTGNYERLTFQFNPVADGSGTITVSNGVDTEVLMSRVDCIRKPDNTCYDAFTYASSRLEFDSNANGVTSALELDAAPTVGNGDGALNGDEVTFVDRVSFALHLTAGDRSSNFYADAQLRNFR